MRKRIRLWFVKVLAEAMLKAKDEEQKRDAWIKNHHEWKYGISTREELEEKYAEK